MTIRPIIFSTPMVQALLAGRKTQTRRLASSPLGRVEVGDLLYVRESWGVGTRPCPFKGCIDGFEYRADQEFLDEHDALPLYQIEPPEGFEMEDWRDGWRPSIHMPRWLSRLTLEVIRVRFDRLQAISHADALAEGIIGHHGIVSVNCAGGVHSEVYGHRYFVPGWEAETEGLEYAEDAFLMLWDTLHDKPGERWADDPQIVALSFRVHHANVDQIAAGKAAA
jgi:hypothetical protein